MAEVIAVGSDGTRKAFSLHFDGAVKNFALDVDRIRAKAVSDLDLAAWDLLEIACTVFAADSSVARGGATRPNFGAGWRRSFEFRIPVRQIDLWNAPEMRGALADTIAFLTDDQVGFAFTARESPSHPEPFLITESATPFQADEIILFSGGLDSLAGAVERLASGSDRVLLVTHRSAQKAIPRQDMLGRDLARGFPGRVQHAQIRATRLGTRAADSTQRSRSFLFAALAYAFARMFGSARISFFENGVISHNLPISPQVIGTMATRTTHPETLNRLGRVLDLVAEHQGQPRIALGNPYEWLTKTEVVSRLVAHDGAPLIRSAVSCTSLRLQSRAQTHCGTCSQCIDRRFAMLAAGAEAHDPAEAYITEVFTGERSETRSRTMALDWTRNAWDLADLDPLGFLARFSAEFARVSAAHKSLGLREAAAKICELHQRHSHSVREALGRALASSSRSLLDGSLPETSLLRMATAMRLGEPAPAFAPTVSAAVNQQPTADAAPALSQIDGLLPLEVEFRNGPHGLEVDVRRLTTLVRQQADLVYKLKPAFDEARAAMLPRENYRFLPGSHLHPASEDAAKMIVRRIRTALAEAYELIEGRAPDRHLLIETKPKHGYRLDPSINPVGPLRHCE